MFAYKINQNGDSQVELITEEAIKAVLTLYNKLFPKRDKYLEYNIDKIRGLYHNLGGKWLSLDDNFNFAPYQIIHDYTENPLENWGEYKFDGMFEYPHELAMVKTHMVRLMNKQLYKKDNPCPRVREVKKSGKNLVLKIQKAFYFDQVGSNLSLDYKLPQKIAEEIGAETIRKWDMLNSQSPNGTLPSFERSRLANTIGIAVGMVAKNKYGQELILTRMRTGNVAVYKNMYHVPFSFALNFSKVNEKSREGSIKELIRPDFHHEMAEELGLEPSDFDFEEVKPLLLCRDLCRGGKPQFFLELIIKTPYEKIIRRINESSGREFSGATQGIETSDISDLRKKKFSPELMAYILIKARGQKR